MSEQTRKLLDISLLRLLSKDYLVGLFLKYPKFLPTYKKLKMIDIPKEAIHFPALIQLFLERMVAVSTSLDSIEHDTFTYFEKFVELLCDLLS